MGSRVNIIVSYNGVWEQKGEKWNFKAGSNTIIHVPIDVGYIELLEKLYSKLKVDRSLFDLKLEVPFTCNDFSVDPIEITDDEGVSALILENSKSLKHQVPLCVSSIAKNIALIDPSPRASVNMENHNQSCTAIPQTATGPSVCMGGPSHNETFFPPTNLPHDDGYEYEPYVNDDPIALFGDDDERVEGCSSSDDNSEDHLSMLHVVQVDNLNVRPLPSRQESQGRRTAGSESSRPTTQDDGNRWSSPAHTAEDIPCPSYVIPTLSGVSCGVIEVGKVFENKLELKTKAHLYAMKQNFEFVVKKSGTKVWYITCKDPDCGWRLRGKRIPKSDMFEITRFTNKHTCSLDLRHKGHRQAAPWVIGHCIKKKYQTGSNAYMANNIREDIKNDYGIELSYGKAWRCREKALSYVRGTLEASYQKLPSYLFMLQQNNPGTLTDFVTEEDRFKYCFFSLGVSRRGFRTCRPVLCVDGTFLKTKYGGQMLCAVALDANNHLYPVAFGIVDSENHDSWKYFMSKLKEAIGEVEDLAFVSDRHASITHALETIFPDAYHGACYHHISMNVVAKFKTDHCHVLMYNIMISNYAESFNNKTRDARSFPITTFVEFIRFTLQSWFCNRRETSEKTTTTLAPTYEKILVDMAEKARFLIPYAIGRHEFHVLDGELNGEVDLLNKTCTCGVFQIIGIPCAHALSGSLKRGVNFYSLCSDYYKIETWRSSYTESIYPTGNEEEWIVPHDIMTITVRTPAQKNPAGRPKKKQGRPKMKRHPSNGDKLVVPRKCSTCGGLGHNRATCKVRV
ncbi:uncharacterized protein LOC133806813 [Humulus lupulus]|uniref:uncharacterized protein LOC133806813 n=1 Tax=Humulus lupulus TaxID=3486 RepID=UPI002B407C04|nr:uncharacterized protein LOC133806813 [Humulus lupulus]